MPAIRVGHHGDSPAGEWFLMTTRSQPRMFAAALVWLLRIVAVIAAVTGGLILLDGATGVGGEPVDPSVESELRFLVVFWLAYGGVAVWASLDLASRGWVVTPVAWLLGVGAVSRMISLNIDGAPKPSYVIGIGIEVALAVSMLILERLWRRTSDVQALPQERGTP